MALRVLRKLHRWIGLLLLLPLLVEGITGTILTLEPLWGQPSLQSSAVTAPIPANAMLQLARNLAPPGMRITRFNPPSADGAPATFYLSANGPTRGGSVVRIDPASLRQIGETESATGPIGVAHGLHASLLIPGLGGRSILGWTGIGLVLLILSGIPLWWPASGQVRAAFTVPSGARGVRLHRRLHGALGIWLLPLLLLSGVTGAVLGFPQTSRQWLRLPAGGPPRAPTASIDQAPPEIPDIDRAIALARAALPGTTPRMIILPAAREPVRLIMATPGASGAVANSVVQVAGGRIVSVQNAADASGADLALRWMRDLHTGDGIGLAGRLLVALAGLALPVFGVTGAAMWWLKRRNRQFLKADRAASLQAGE
jgi:uncharacterized iron-regulated membrane protein